MKDSGIAWIGMIPDDWTVETGAHIFELLERPVKENDEVITCFRDGEVTLRSKRREDGYTFSLKEIGYQGIEPGDLVVHGMDGFAGAIGISDSRGKGTPVLNVLNSDHNKKFLMYSLRSMAYNDVFTSLSTGIRVRSSDTGWKKLKSIPYALPPAPVQNRIAAYLDKKCAGIDTLISMHQAVIDKLKEYKLSLITEVVTKGIIDSRPLKPTGFSYVSEIPSSWENRKLLRALSMRVIDGPHESPELFDEGIPYISATAIANGHIDFSLQRGFISPEYCDECDKRYKPQRNDILVIKLGASTGQVAIVETDDRFNIWVPLAAVRCNESAYPLFVYYAFQSDYFLRQMQQSWTYGTQQTLGVKSIEALHILLPPLDEQKEIASFLKRRVGVIDSSISTRESLITKLAEYKKSLIYEVVTGKKEV